LHNEIQGLRTAIENAGERKLDKAALSILDREKLETKEKEIKDIQAQIQALDEADKTRDEQFQGQLQPSFVQLEVLSKNIAVYASEAELLQQERGQILALTAQALKTYEDHLVALDGNQSSEKLSKRQLEKAKNKLNTEYQKIILEINKKLVAFDNQPVKGAQFSKGERLNILNSLIDSAHEEKTLIEHFISQQVQKRVELDDGGGAGNKLSVLQGALNTAQTEARDLNDQYQLSAQLAQFTETYQTTLTTQLTETERTSAERQQDLSEVERELAQLAQVKDTLKNKIDVQIKTEQGAVANIRDDVSQLLSEHSKITLIFSGHLEPSTLPQSELENLLRATDEVLLDHPVFFANSHAPLWRLGRSRIEEAVLPALLEEKNTLLALGQNISAPQQLRLEQIDKLLVRTPELPVLPELQGAALTKHRALESEARVYLARALSDIRAGGRPTEVALAIPFKSELRQTLHQLLAIRQLGGFYPGQTDLGAEQLLASALEETGLLPLIQNDIRQNGRVQVQLYIDLLSEKKKEASEILTLRNEATVAIANLQELYAEENADGSTITEQTRESSEQVLQELYQVADLLKTKQEQSNDSIRLVQKRIQLGQNIEQLATANNEDLALYRPYIEQAQRDHTARALGQKTDAVVADPIAELAKHPVLTDEIRATAQAALSGLTSEKQSDEAGGLEAKNVTVTLSRLGFKTNRTLSDGNCFYHAIAVQLNPGLSIQELRNKVADEAQAIRDLLIDNPDNLPTGILYELTPAQIQATRTDATTVTDVEQRVASWGEAEHGAYVARLTERPVVIFTADQGVLIFEKGKASRRLDYAVSGDLPVNAILLAHNGSDHWESVSLIGNQLPAYAPGTVIATAQGDAAVDASLAEGAQQLQAALDALQKISDGLTVRARYIAVTERPAPIDKTQVGLVASLSAGLADPNKLSVQELQAFLASMGDLEEQAKEQELNKPLELAAYKSAQDALIFKVRTHLNRLDQAIAKNQQELVSSGWDSTAAVVNAKVMANILRDKHAQQALDDLKRHELELTTLKVERDEYLKILGGGYEKGKKGRHQYLIGASLALLRTKSEFDPLNPARMIFNEGALKEVIDELKLRQRLVLRNQAAAVLFDPASAALLEACEVIQYAYSLRGHLLQNAGEYPVYAPQLVTANDALNKLRDDYNKIMADLQRERKEIETYEKAGAVKKLVLSKDNYEKSKQNEKNELADLMTLSEKLSEAELLVANITDKTRLLALVRGKYADTIKLVKLDLAQKVGEKSARISVTKAS
jgi:hypothetical protein